MNQEKITQLTSLLDELIDELDMYNLEAVKHAQELIHLINP